METFWQWCMEWGMEWIIVIQAAGGPLAQTIFGVITFMGEEQFYLIVVPILFWSVDAVIGARVGFAFLISGYTNLLLKDFFYHPRPCEINPSVCDDVPGGTGMPSGHSQSSVFVWGVLAAQVKRPWFWVFAMFMAFLIGTSRVVLGVHFPYQVFFGWVFGVIFLLLFLWLDPRVEKAVSQLSLAPQLAVTLGVPLFLALLHPHNDTVSAAAVMAGFSSGIVLTLRFIPFSAKGKWWKRVLRSVIGIVILLALYIGLSTIFPGEEAGETQYYIFRFLRYGILGLWIGLGAPWLFSILHLLPKQELDLDPESS
jgi:membrane-associated phospholipid phosphatase